MSFGSIWIRTMLKALAAIVGAAVCALAIFVAYQSWPRPIDVANYEEPFLDYRLPPADLSGPDIQIGLVTTSYAQAPEGLLFNGGNWLKKSRSVTSGLLVRHPRATFLFEGGVGSRIQGEFERNFNGWQKALFAHVYERPLLAQLRSAGVDPAAIDFLVITHLHWDHAGVIKDFPGTKIRVTQEEYDGALKAAARGAVGTFAEQINDPTIQWDFVHFANARFGPFAQSLDLFGDGSVVLVPLAGHTEGQLGMFLTLKSGQRYFFIGDASWSAKAVGIPRERIPFARDMVDADPEAARRELVLIYKIAQSNPGLHIIPVHDGEALEALPKLARLAP
jgi:glyoxylase-like metal-dependent hydrolase (beta-lactamase superfamily II)